MKQDILDIVRLWDELKKVRATKESKETKVSDDIGGGSMPPTEEESEE
jgi:hypothetical protein